MRCDSESQPYSDFICEHNRNVFDLKNSKMSHFASVRKICLRVWGKIFSNDKIGIYIKAFALENISLVFDCDVFWCSAFGADIVLLFKNFLMHEI